MILVQKVINFRVFFFSCSSSYTELSSSCVLYDQLPKRQYSTLPADYTEMLSLRSLSKTIVSEQFQQVLQ